MQEKDFKSSATDILRLMKLCFRNGKTIDGKLWNTGNELIRERYNMSMDEWYNVRTNFVNPILKQLDQPTLKEL